MYKLYTINGQLIKEVDNDDELIPEKFTGIVKSDNGDEEYLLDGEPHRIDGPAIIGKNDGLCQYWLLGKLHRMGGPAVFYNPASGSQDNLEEYWVNNIEYTKEKYLELFA